MPEAKVMMRNPKTVGLPTLVSLDSASYSS